MTASIRWFPLFCSALLAWSAGAAAADAALASNADIEASLRELLVASPYKLSVQARAGTIRYVLEARAGAAADAAWSWPETFEQHAQTQGARTLLTVCSDCGRETAPSAAELKRYLSANAWVDSDAASVRAFARQAGGGASVDSRMSALVLAIQKHMNGAIDYRRYAGASEALASREGDCTEFAVLLAAAARARGIPARVVAGLVYDSRFLGRPHAFGPHLWVQVWTGERWRSYDAAVGRFDAGHLALALGDGRPEDARGVMEQIARLRIVDAAGVLPAADEGKAIKDSSTPLP